jgi:hypothetical protein
MCRKSSRHVLLRWMHPWCVCMVKRNPRVLLRRRKQLRHDMCACMVKWNPRVFLKRRQQPRHAMYVCMLKRNRLSNLASTKLRNTAVGRETSEWLLVSVASWRRGVANHLRDVVLVDKKVNHSRVESIHRLFLIICFCPRSVHFVDSAGSEVCNSETHHGETFVDVSRSPHNQWFLMDEFIETT